MSKLPQRLPGESWKDFESRVRAWSNGDDVRTKTDLRNYKTCDFSLDRSPTSAPDFQAPHNSGERLPSSDAAEAGAET